MSESEAEIADFLRKNWIKLGLFDYYFEYGLLGGNAVAVESGTKEIVGIEHETRPGRYFEHGHHKNPSHAEVKYIFESNRECAPRSHCEAEIA